jgi:hypothetical protein
MKVDIKITVLWVAMSLSLVDTSFSQEPLASVFSVSTLPTRLHCHVPEDCNLNIICFEVFICI